MKASHFGGAVSWWWFSKLLIFLWKAQILSLAAKLSVDFWRDRCTLFIPEMSVKYLSLNSHSSSFIFLTRKTGKKRKKEEETSGLGCKPITWFLSLLQPLHLGMRERHFSELPIFPHSIKGLYSSLWSYKISTLYCFIKEAVRWNWLLWIFPVNVCLLKKKTTQWLLTHCEPCLIYTPCNFIHYVLYQSKHQHNKK